MPRDDQAAVRHFYDEYGAREWQRLDAEPGARVLSHLHALLLRGFVRTADRVLDAGAGAGRLARELVELGAYVSAGDVSPVQVRLCRVHAPGADAVQLTATALPFSDARFDVVVCFGAVLSHLGEEAEAGLAELVRVTRP